MSKGVMGGEEIMGWGIMIDEVGWRKGPWTAEEDKLLIEYVNLHGEGRWNSVARFQGLKRNGKSCRLRWVNYLRPDLKRGQITPHEERVIIELHAKWGNRWSTIARSLPGRTDNEIKNYWRTHFKKKAKGSADSSEKSRIRLLRKQQFHLQQLQQQKQQQQEQKQQQNIIQMDNESRVMTTITLPQGTVSYPNLTDQEQSFCFAMMNGGYAPPLMPPLVASTNDQEIMTLWDGLWNLDDFQPNFCTSVAANNNKFCTLQPIPAPFY